MFLQNKTILVRINKKAENKFEILIIRTKGWFASFFWKLYDVNLEKKLTQKKKEQFTKCYIYTFNFIHLQNITDTSKIGASHECSSQIFVILSEAISVTNNLSINLN